MRSKIIPISLKRVFSLFFFIGIGIVSFAQKNPKSLCVQPAVAASADVTICNGATTVLTATITTATTPDYDYAWTPAASLGTPNANTASLTHTTTATPSVTTTYTIIVTDNLGCISNPDFVTVTVLATPTVSVSGTNTICNGQSTTLTASGAATYSWMPGGSTTTSITVSPTTSTNYTVTGTANGCSATATRSVTVNATPTVSITELNSLTSICNGESVRFTASGASTYTWSPGGGTGATIVFSPTSSTNYTVTATSANGCTDTETYSVTVNATPTVSITDSNGGGSNSICNGQSETLTAAGAATYSWMPGGSTTTSIVVSPTTSVNYTVTGTSAASCTSTATYSLTIKVLPTPSITASPSFTICNGSSTTLTTPGSSSSTYAWIPGGATSNEIVVNPTTTTGYTVTETMFGCSASASQTVTVNPLPTANAGPDASVCAGDNITLSGSGNGTFSWAPSTGLSCTTCPNPVSTPTGNITYTLSVTNSCGTATDEVSITNPALPSSNAGQDVTICIGASTTLSGSGGGAFSWASSTGLSCTTCANPVANPTASITYTLTITASCGSNSDEVIVTVADPIASISGNTTICSGQATTLTASGGTTYSWSTGSTTNPLIDSPTNTTTYTVVATDANGCTDDDAIMVIVNPLPTANAGADASICFGGNTTLTATGNGTFLWSPSTGLSCTTCSNPTADPTTTTTYTVTVTNSCGSISDDVVVTVSPLPSVNAGTDATICFGESTTLNAIGNGTFLWSPSAGLSNTTIANPVANPTATTDYSVTVTDICGTASDVVRVIVNQLPVPIITGSSTICLGSTDTLVVTGGGTYVWNGGSTNDSIFVSPAIATGYDVTVTSASGCTATTSFTVDISSATATISGTNNTICSGQSSTLTASGGGTYVWSTSSTTASIVVSPTASTDYTVTVSNALGCTAVATFSISVTTNPTALASATSNTICAGNSTSLNASGGTSYVWSPSTGLNQTTISNPVSTSTSSVTYTVIVSNGGCSDTASIAITVNALPTAAASASANTICVGSCTSLSATGGSSYVWVPGGQTGSPISECPTSSVTYTVTTTDANGCTDDATILINVLPLVNAFVSGDSVICVGDFTVLTAQGGTAYSWNTGETTSSISVSPGTNTGYTVLVSNGACSDIAVINVGVDPLPTASASASPYTINIGNQTTLTAATSTGTYSWSPAAGLSCTTCSGPVASPTITTVYTVATVDSNGCIGTDTVIVNVTLECDEVFVPTAFSPNNDGFNDYLYVRNPCVMDMEFSVYNRWGQKVFFTDDITVGWDGTFNGKPVDPAVFFYTISIKFITGTDRYIDGNVTLVR